MRFALSAAAVSLGLLTPTGRAGPVALMNAMESLRKDTPPAQTLSEMNGFALKDVDGNSFLLSHLSGVAQRLGVKSRDECLTLLTYLKDRDPKIRFIAASAIENVVHAYPRGMSLSDTLDIDSAGHREMVRRFAGKIEELRPDGTTDAPLAAGDWSEPVEGLRGRLILGRGRLLGDGTTRESVVYLELRYAPAAVGDPVNVYFDPSLRWEMRDTLDKPVPSQGTAGSGQPGPHWVTLPYDSTIRLRVSPYGFGRPNGLLVPVVGASWFVAANDPGHYSLSGEFTARPPDGHGRERVWRGTLKLPALRLPPNGR
jgi:hypothetical protein